MNIPQGLISLDVRRVRLADLIEMAAASLRGDGKESDALALFRLRIKIREGLSYEKAKSIFDKHTKTYLEEKS
jgi:hypothetical protein